MRFLFFILLTTVSYGCATTSKYQEDKTLSAENSATINIYRTNRLTHSLNPEKPFFYLDGKVVAKLGTGQFKMVRVPAGNYELIVRESAMFMPGSKIASLSANFETGKEYFIRYDFSLTRLGGKSQLSLVEEEYFAGRR